jgi:hypothetical protein
MKCEEVCSALVGFHFGVAEEAHGEVEAHLLDCRSCLRTYLALKRDLDLAASSTEVPSAAAEARLRAAVAAELRGRAASARRWQTPVSFALASAAVCAAVATTSAVANTAGAAPRGLAPSPPADAPSAR